MKKIVFCWNLHSKLHFWTVALKFPLVKMLSGPRHTTNPSHIRKFWVQKVTHKKLLNFSEKIHRYFKTILHLCPKHLRRHYPWKIRPDFDLKELEIFWFQKICIFWSFFDIFKFHLQKNILVLTKCWLKYYRSIRNLLLIFFIFWSRVVSPKLKKYLMTQTPPQKKGPFFGGGSRALPRLRK